MHHDFFYIEEDFHNSTSTLYNLEPIGIGSIYCESITSYLVRLAEAHCLKPGVLINKIIAPVLNKMYLLQSATYGGNRFFDGAKTLNGVDENSFEIVNTLQSLTSRDNLINLTLQKWNRVFTCRGLLKKNLSWCPLCLEEFKNESGLYYYPLIWFMQPVKSCINHNILLVEICSSCRKTVPVLHRSSKNGHCPYCDNQLTNSEIIKIAETDMEKEEYKVKSIGKLIAFSESLEYKLNRGIFCLKLNQIDEFYRKECQKSLLEILDVPKVTLYYWLRGESIPTLETITNICYSIGISLFSFFFEENLNPSFITQKMSRNIAPNKSKRRKLDHLQLEDNLRSYLNKDVPLSMEAIAKDIGVSKRTLYRNIPVICKELSKRYLEHTNNQSLERKKEVIMKIDKSIKELTQKSVRISQKNIEIHLSSNALVREKFARDYLYDYLENID